MKVDAPEAVASRIWQGIARDRDTIYPGPVERLLLLVQHLAPGLVDGALAPKLRKARAALLPPA